MIVTIGSILLAICGLPEAIISFKTKRCSIGWGMLLCWLFGEILLSIFAIQTKQYVLLINYFTNLTILGIMIKYKIPRETEAD
jgi:uncharacterized protein with PQ loop repeat